MEKNEATMKEILKYAETDKIINNKNIIINKSLENKINEDRVIKIITKEVSSFISRLFKTNY
jgi:hypothetical protein